MTPRGPPQDLWAGATAGSGLLTALLGPAASRVVTPGLAVAGGRRDRDRADAAERVDVRVEGLAAAEHVLRAAMAAGRGIAVELAGGPDAPS